MSKISFTLPLFALIVLSFLGCCMELDISIPSFPSMVTHFGATEAQVQNTLSINFLAFCLSGLLYGPLSECWGRRGLMVIGATLFLIGAVGCVFSFSIYQLMFWRFIQGLGASSTIVLGFAMISDRYVGEQATSYIGKINAYVTIFMASAPILGSFIIQHFTWRANFIAIAVIALITWFFLVFQLPETRDIRQPVKIKTILKDYAQLLMHREFMMLSLMPNALVTAYLTFVASAAFYYIDFCELSYFDLALNQGLVVVSFSLTSFYANAIIQRIGANKAVLFGVTLSLVSMVVMLICAFSMPFDYWFITGSMMVSSIGCAFPMSVTFSESLEAVPHLKGPSSSFIMASRLMLSAIAIALTGEFFDGSMKPVAIVNASLVLLAVILYYLIERSRTASEKMAVAP